MNEHEDLIARFRGEQRISSMMKYSLDILNDIREQQSIQVNKLGESLLDIESFLNERYDIDIDIAHLTKHAEFLDEFQFAIIRKKILDYGGVLRREL